MTEDLEPGAPLMDRMTFDLQKTANIRMALLDISAILDEAGFVAKAAYARAALSEIERQAKRIADLEGQIDLTNTEIAELRKGKDAQATISNLMDRIAELVGELDVANSYIRTLESKRNQEGLMWACDKLNSKIDKQRAALKKLGKRSGRLGKTLVEERAGRDLIFETNREIVPWTLDEVCVDDQTRLRTNARQQLRREGKI